MLRQLVWYALAAAIAVALWYSLMQFAKPAA
jgi:hypothetical protein